jgi:transposase
MRGRLPALWWPGSELGIERDPLDRKGEDRRVVAPAAGSTTRLSPRRIADFIVGMMEVCPDIALNEMVDRLEAERSLRIGRSALNDWLRWHGWTFKKSPHMHWSRTVPTS